MTARRRDRGRRAAIALAAGLAPTLALTLALTGVGRARADDGPTACATPLADPVALPWRTTGLDAGRGACLRPGVALAFGGRALIDTPGFYGSLGADAEVSARFTLGGIEWLAAARGSIGFVQNAVLKATEPGYGPLTIGATVGRDRRWRDRPLRLGLTARVELPATERRLGSTRLGGQLAALVTWRPTSRWYLHARLGVIGERTWSALDASGRAGGLIGGDVARGLGGGRLFVGLGVDAQLGWYRAGLDHLAARVGVGVAIAGGWRTSLAVGMPVVGAERTDLAFVVAVTRGTRAP